MMKQFQWIEIWNGDNRWLLWSFPFNIQISNCKWSFLKKQISFQSSGIDQLKRKDRRLIYYAKAAQNM